MKYFYILFLIFSVETLLTQTPVLVKDINPGPIGSAVANYPHIQINDVLYFVGDILGKRDLYSVKDGQVQQISQICSSNCSFFEYFNLEYNNKLYFVKRIDSKINQLWSSDGTVDGTTLIFEYPGAFRSMVVGKNEKIYIGIYNRNTFKDEIFISDGTPSGTKIIANNLKFGGNEEAFGLPVSYENGVAFANITNDSLFIYAFDEDILNLMGKLKVNKGSIINGFKSINSYDLAILVHSDDSSTSELYRYNAQKNEINNEITLPFERQKYPHLKDFGRDTLMLFHKAGGNFFLTGTSQFSVINITPFSNLNKIVDNYYYASNFRGAYHSTDISNSIIKEKIVLFDKNLNNKKIIDLDLTPTDIIGYHDYAFSVTQSSSGMFGKITMYFLPNKTAKEIINISQSFSTNGIKPLGLIGSKLYFLANLNQSFGKELYYVETGISTSTEDNFSKVHSLFTIEIKGNTYMVKSESNHTLNVEFLDTSGRSLLSKIIDTNTEYIIDENLGGFMFLKATDLETLHSKSTSIYIH